MTGRTRPWNATARSAPRFTAGRWPHKMTMKRKLALLFGGLVAVELLMAGLMMLSGHHQQQLYRRLYPDVQLPVTDPALLSQMMDRVAAEHNNTAYRKVDLMVIAYHIPILAGIGSLAGDRYLTPYVFMPLAILIYGGIGTLIIRKIGQHPAAPYSEPAARSPQG